MLTLKSLWKILLPLSVLLLIGGVAMASIHCNTYPNSRAVVVWGTATCAYTGSGCNECYYPDNGSYCVGSGENMICDGPDFQNYP